MEELDLAQHLYIRSLTKAAEEDDLWWQMRALQELHWDSELAAFFEKNTDRIEESGDETLRALLAEAQGRDLDALEHRKEAARRGDQPYMWFGSEEGAEAEGEDGSERSEDGDSEPAE